MRLLIVVLLLTTVLATSPAQVEKLSQFEKSTLGKVILGMSTEEVKKTFGPPKAIESGFPDASGSMISTMPEQRGQLTSSTWFYSFATIPIKVNSYMLNAKKVSKEIYEAYTNQDTVFSQDGDIVFPAEADGYRFLKDSRFEARKKSTDEQFTGITKVSRTYKPLLCVIFDKGTQVVARAKMYFILSGS